MFVVSVKVSTLKVAAVLLALGVVIAVAAWPRGAVQASTAGQKYTGISTNEKRIGFLESYGWKVESNPIEVVEVTIPQSFNEVYDNYNRIQKKQGFDLSDFKGKRVKRWTYKVTNYPGVKDEVRANMLVYDNKVIGGDISTVALNGFMHGFSLTDGSKTQSTNMKPSSANIVGDILDGAA